MSERLEVRVGSSGAIDPKTEQALALLIDALRSIADAALEADQPASLLRAHEAVSAQLAQSLGPDVLVKGGDYRAHEIVGADYVRARGGRVIALPFAQGRSTTQLLARILHEDPA